MSSTTRRAVRPQRRVFGGALALVATAALLTACGSDDSDSPASAGDSAGATATQAASPQVAEAKEALVRDTAEPTSLEINEPLSEKPPGGKTIAFIQCAVADCRDYGDALEEAVKLLDWKVERIEVPSTAEGVVQGMDRALRLNPDGIFLTGTPRAAISKPLEEAAKRNIPVVNSAVSDPVEPPYIAVTNSDAAYERGAQMIADWIIADSNGSANVAMFSLPDYPILNVFSDAVIEQLKERCPECETSVHPQKVTDIGTKLPANTVSVLQRDPEIDYVIFGTGGMTDGLPAALRAAGLEGKVKIGGTTPTPANFKAVLDGTEHAWQATPLKYLSWVALDAFARHFVGDDPAIDTTAELPSQLLLKSNLKGTDRYEGFPGYREAFEQMWNGESPAS